MTVNGDIGNGVQPLSCRARAFSVEALLQRSNSPTPKKDYSSISDTEYDPSLTETNKQAQTFGHPSSLADASSTYRSSAKKCDNNKQEQLVGEAKQPRVELCSKELWKKFHALGTEMIITKAGRRMFPTVKARLHDLLPDSNYIVFLDIIPVDDKRYRYVYHSSQWTVAGAGDPPLPRSIYVHPDSPASGQLWMAQGVITFDKLKLTNNRRPIVRGQVSLHSMHKYQPRVHVLKTDDLETPAEIQVTKALHNHSSSQHPEVMHVGPLSTFTFAETCFTTVTAYQNQQITRLKIASNPFAKGFREASKSRECMDDSLQHHRSTTSFSPHFTSFGVPEILTPHNVHASMFPNESSFSPHSTWPAAQSTLSMPVKFVIPPSMAPTMGSPLLPYLHQPSPSNASHLLPPCTALRPAYLVDFMRLPLTSQSNIADQIMYSKMSNARASEVLDLSTFK